MASGLADSPCPTACCSRRLPKPRAQPWVSVILPVGKGFICFFPSNLEEKKKSVCSHVGSINVIFKLLQLCLETKLISKWGGTALPRVFAVHFQRLKYLLAAVSSEVRCAGTCSADDMPPPPAPALGDRCDVPAVPYVGEQSPSAFRGRHQEIKRNQTEKGARESQDRGFSVGT